MKKLIKTRLDIAECSKVIFLFMSSRFWFSEYFWLIDFLIALFIKIDIFTEDSRAAFQKVSHID